MTFRNREIVLTLAIIRGGDAQVFLKGRHWNIYPTLSFYMNSHQVMEWSSYPHQTHWIGLRLYKDRANSKRWKSISLSDTSQHSSIWWLHILPIHDVMMAYDSIGFNNHNYANAWITPANGRMYNIHKCLCNPSKQYYHNLTQINEIKQRPYPHTGLYLTNRILHPTLQVNSTEKQKCNRK